MCRSHVHLKIEESVVGVSSSGCAAVYLLCKAVQGFYIKDKSGQLVS